MENKPKSMKRTRWMKAAFMIGSSILLELEASLAFSSSVSTKSHSATLENGCRAVPHGEGSLCAVAPGEYAVGESSELHSLQVSKRLDILNLQQIPTSIERRPALETRTRNARIMRPSSRNSSPKIDKRLSPRNRGALLTKDEEGVLTRSIASLRQAIRIRDELALNSNINYAAESDWASACGLSIIELRRLMRDGQEARSRLVSANVGLVTAIAKRHHKSLKYATEAGGGVGTILTLQDMIQEGNLGLMQAAERFEPERGNRFSTYATYWVKQRILRSISDSSRIIRLPAHVHAMLQKVNKSRKDMIHEIGRPPSVPELAHYMEMSVEELEKLTSRARNVVSLENRIRSGGSPKEDNRKIVDFVVSDAPTPEEDAESQHLKQDIRAVIAELQVKEREVLILRFGLDDGNPMSINQISKHLGISSDRVRNIEARALNKLRNPQRNYRLKEYLCSQEEKEQIPEETCLTPERMWFV
ncbi:unnamed protein product [Cylindrotheca closterium]|uniref:RNA polymerase sigma-70 domain-containing protein n=1 Tax=Cylindrotheca closterium TaxID=2856 RepID=A0AAD2CTH4_9STRA|nr:unnamed protein product [Cylindrotheca closterium]